MPPAENSTSLQRTYRYLRIGIAGTVGVIFVSVGLATAPSWPLFRALYSGIAVLLAVVLVVYIVLLPRTSASDIPIALVAEAAALALFFAFWVVQGIEYWNEADPRVRAA